MTTQDPTRNAVAVLFTDGMGQVVFVDQTFLKLMNYREAGVVAGEPLHKALQLDQKIAKSLLDDLRRHGQVADRMIEIPRSNGDGTRKVACTGVATFDDSGSFIGADLTLRRLSATDTSEMGKLQRSDMMRSRIEQMMAEMIAEATDAPLRVFFNAQIEALHVLLVRVIGRYGSNGLEQLVNTMARQHIWELHLSNGVLTIGTAALPAEAYRALLNGAIKYAIDVIGARVVSRELNLIEENIDLNTRQQAENAGLFGLYQH